MYFKTRNLTIFFILFSTFLFSQTFTTKFILSGYLVDKPERKSNTTCEFKKKKEVKIIDFVNERWWKVDYKGCVGYVTSPFILITDELIELREIKYKKLQVEIHRKNDSIQNVISNERELKKRIKRDVLKSVKDSLLKIKTHRFLTVKKEPSLFGKSLFFIPDNEIIIVLDYIDNYYKVCLDSKCGYVNEMYIFSGNKKQDELLRELKKIRTIQNKELIRKQEVLISKEREKKSEREKYVYYNECSYEVNEIDEFTGLRRKKTISYHLNLYGGNFGELIYIKLSKYGNSKYLIIDSSSVGCISPYSPDISNVKFKLENGDIVTFYHIGEIDCGSSYLISKLNLSNINRLKKSPIKTIRLTGTDSYNDFKEIVFKDFFIKKLDCIK